MRRATLLLTSLSLLAMPLAASLAAGTAVAVTTAAAAACRAPVVAPNDAAGQPLLDNVRV